MELNAYIFSIWMNNFYLRLNENIPIKSKNGVLIPPDPFHLQEVAAPSFLASVFLSPTTSIPHGLLGESAVYIRNPAAFPQQPCFCLPAD